MKYKMILCDFDGTLGTGVSGINENGRPIVTERSKKAIGAYMAKGGIFILCTGRSYSSCVEYAKDLGLLNQKVGVSCLMGTLIPNADGTPAFDLPLSHDVTLKIARALDETGEYYHFYDWQDIYVKENNDITRNYERICGVKVSVRGVLGDFIESSGKSANKFVIICKGDERIVIDKIRSLGIDGLELGHSGPKYLEVYSAEGGKKRAAEELCRIYGLEPDDVMAIGDSFNDISMLKAVGFGVAVGNATDDVKAAADYVAESNNDDGVAKTIEKFCLNEKE